MNTVTQIIYSVLSVALQCLTWEKIGHGEKLNYSSLKYSHDSWCVTLGYDKAI